MARDEGENGLPDGLLAPDALLIARLDRRGAIRAGGERFRAALGRDWSEILGAPLRRFVEIGSHKSAFGVMRRLGDRYCGCDYVQIRDGSGQQRLAFAFAAPLEDGAALFLFRPTGADDLQRVEAPDPREAMAAAAAAELTGRNLARGRANSPQAAKAILLSRAAARLASSELGAEVAAAAHEAMIARAAAEISGRAVLRLAEAPPQTAEIDPGAEARRLSEIVEFGRSSAKAHFEAAAAAAISVGEGAQLSPEERAACEAARAHGAWLARNA